MVVYAVIDTNVLVSAILAVHPNSATVIIREKIMTAPLFHSIMERLSMNTKMSFLGQNSIFPLTWSLAF